MTTTACALLLMLPPTAAAVVGLATMAVDGADAPEPWNYGIAVGVLVVLVLPMVAWLMRRQDQMHAENVAREKRRDEIEAERADAFGGQVRALEACVEQLRQLNERQRQSDLDRKDAVSSVLRAVDVIPDRVANKLRNNQGRKGGPAT